MFPMWLDRYGLYEYTNCFYNPETDRIETKIENSLDLPSFTTDFMIAPYVFENWSHFEYETNGNIVIKYRTDPNDYWKDIDSAPVISEMCINKISTKYIDVKYPVKRSYSIKKEKFINQGKKSEDRTDIEEQDKKYNVEFNNNIHDSNRIYYKTYDYTKMNPCTTQIVIYEPDIHWLHVEIPYIQFKIFIASKTSNTELIKGWDSGMYDYDTYYDGGFDPEQTLYLENACVMVEDNNLTNAEQFLPNFFGWY